MSHRIQTPIAIALAVIVVLTGALVAASTFINMTEPVSAESPSVPPPPVPTAYRIVYFVTPDAATVPGLTDPAHVKKQLGALKAEKWEQVLSLENAAPIAALLIHGSAVNQLDKEWVASAYRRGVVVAAFNLTGAQMADLVDNPCIEEEHFGNHEGSSYIIVSYLLQTENPNEFAPVEDSYRATCGTGAAEVEGLVSLSVNKTADYLNDENDFNIFASELIRHLSSLQQDRIDFLSGALK